MQRGSIAFLLPNLRNGGAETVMVRVANSLAERGHRIFLILVSEEGELLNVVSDAVERINLNKRRVRYALPGIVMALRARRPDAAIATLGRMNILLGIARPLLPKNLRIVAREANTPSVDLRSGGHSAATRILYPYIYRQFDKIICLSDSMVEDIRTTLRVPADRLVRIYNPTPELLPERAQRFHLEYLRKNTRVIVACGRLSRSKGFDILLKAFAEVKKQYGDVQLLILGDGEMKESLLKLSRILQIESSVSFCGFREDRLEFFAHADVVVSASRWEGLPNVLIEALSRGVPVIATDCPGGTREIVANGVNGWLVPPGDVAALATRIVSYLRGQSQLDPALFDGTLKKFQSEEIMNQYEKLLCEP